MFDFQVVIYMEIQEKKVFLTKKKQSLDEPDQNLNRELVNIHKILMIHSITLLTYK